MQSVSGVNFSDIRQSLFRPNFVMNDESRNLLRQDLHSLYKNSNYLNRFRLFGFGGFSFNKVYLKYFEMAKKMAEQSNMLYLVTANKNLQGKTQYVLNLFDANGPIRSQQNGVKLFAMDFLGDRMFSTTKPMLHPQEILRVKVEGLLSLVKRI